MKKKIIFSVLSICLLAAFLSGTTVFADEFYEFDRFNVEITVNSDYTFEVTETISVNYSAEKHGIYRYLPNYWGEDRIKYTDISLQGAKYKIEKSRYYTNIRIGDANETVSGVQHYILKYKIVLPKDSNSELDSVYFNVFGYEHPVVTNESSITISLPSKVDPSYLTVISGFYYDSGISDKLTYNYINRNELQIELVSPLEPYEGITVKIDLPEGYFSDITDPFFIDEFLKKYLPWLLVLVGVVMWFIAGRDKAIIMPVEINPPGVSPIEAGFIVDGIVDGDDIAAMLIYWASKGYISIKETGKKGEYDFDKIKEIEGAPAYEETLFKKLFPLEIGEITTTKNIKSRLSSQGFSTEQSVEKHYEKKAHMLIDAKSKKFSGIVKALSFICFGMIGFFLGLSEDISVAIILFFLFEMLFFFINNWLTRILTYTRKKNSAVTSFKLIFFALVMLIAWVVVYSISSDAIAYGQSFAMMFGAIALSFLSYYTQKMTEDGHHIYERVLGFRHFMLIAEKEWIETLVKDDPQFFYDRLPYALVLGVSRVWIGKFANAILVPPTWYEGDVTSFNARMFASTLSSDFTRIGASAVPKQSSTGGYRSTGSSSFSSGGGFSGGGFSGGGSGSW